MYYELRTDKQGVTPLPATIGGGDGGILKIEEYIKDKSRVLEWGSGGSTLYYNVGFTSIKLVAATASGTIAKGEITAVLSPVPPVPTAVTSVATTATTRTVSLTGNTTVARTYRIYYGRLFCLLGISEIYVIWGIKQQKKEQRNRNRHQSQTKETRTTSKSTSKSISNRTSESKRN